MKPIPLADLAAPPTAGMTTHRDARVTLGGILICGGQSRRMGTDKALLEIDGESMISRVAKLLDNTCSEIQVACGPERRYAELGYSLALDDEPDAGPLSGIRAGLAALGTSHAMVVACDMPRVTRAIIERLFQAVRENDLDICYLATERGVEPLCAVYSRRCLPAIEFALANGVRKVTAFVGLEGAGKTLRVGQVPLQELSEGDDSICNVNTPEELKRVQSEMEGGQ